MMQSLLPQLNNNNNNHHPTRRILHLSYYQNGGRQQQVVVGYYSFLVVVVVLLSIICCSSNQIFTSNCGGGIVVGVHSLQSITLPKWNFGSMNRNNNNNNNFSNNNNRKKIEKQALELEKELVTCIQWEPEEQPQSKQQQKSQDERIQELIQQLEELSISSSSRSTSSTTPKPKTILGQQVQGGAGPIPDPAISSTIYGRWKLIYSYNNQNTASPIQQKAFQQRSTSSESKSSSKKKNKKPIQIYQDILVVNKDQNLQVNQVIEFTPNFYLSVDAVASTILYPIDELISSVRQTTGKVFGFFNVLGVSYVGEEALEKIPNTRITFLFDSGTFYIGDKIRIPYPVPFRLPILRDWVKGWIDITYLSPTVRISKGNKGTTFVLIKEEK